VDVKSLYLVVIFSDKGIPGPPGHHPSGKPGKSRKVVVQKTGVIRFSCVDMHIFQFNAVEYISLPLQ